MLTSNKLKKNYKKPIPIQIKILSFLKLILLYKRGNNKGKRIKKTSQVFGLFHIHLVLKIKIITNQKMKIVSQNF